MATPRTTRFLTRTAILLSLLLVFQVFGRELALGLGLGVHQNFLVGPLVNLCLLVGTAFAGPAAGVALALLAPLGAFATGGLSEPVFLAVVAVGNLILVLCFAVADHAAEPLKGGAKVPVRALGILVGAVLKTAWLWGGITIYARLFAMLPATAASLQFAFSWPQAVTAAAGGALALLVLPALERALPRTSAA